MKVTIGLAFDCLTEKQKQQYILHYITAFVKPIDCEGCVLRIIKYTNEDLWLAPFRENIQPFAPEDSI